MSTSAPLFPPQPPQQPAPQRKRRVPYKDQVAAARANVDGLDDNADSQPKQLVVRDVTYSVWKKKGGNESSPTTLRVDYEVGLNWPISEWLCFDHTGFPREKAEEWWKRRTTLEIPATVEDAIIVVNSAAAPLERPVAIVVKQDGKFLSIDAHLFAADTGVAQ